MRCGRGGGNVSSHVSSPNDGADRQLLVMPFRLSPIRSFTAHRIDPSIYSLFYATIGRKNDCGCIIARDGRYQSIHSQALAPDFHMPSTATRGTISPYVVNGSKVGKFWMMPGRERFPWISPQQKHAGRSHCVKPYTCLTGTV